MRGLIPRDLREHGFGDLVQGLALAMGSRKQDKVIHIHELGECIPVRSG